MSDELDRVRREMHAVLQKPGVRPDDSVRITRRTFMHRSLLFGAATVGQTFAWWPLINTIDVAHAAEAPFKFAWISDTHLYPKSLNTRFVDKVVRAAKDVQAMDPPADFLIFGGDLAQLGNDRGTRARRRASQGSHDPEALHPGRARLVSRHGQEVGRAVRQAQLDLRPQGRALHRARHGQPGTGLLDGEEDDARGAHGPHGDPRRHRCRRRGPASAATSSTGCRRSLADWDKAKPVVIFSHNPLYEYYPPWNFWVRDWRDVHEVLKPYTKVTNIHGHVHQVLYNEIGTMRSIGMLATSWPWPYAPEGVPKLTKPMIRVDPGDHFDGVGWETVNVQRRRQGRRRVHHVGPQGGLRSIGRGLHDKSHPGDLRPRIADNMWPYLREEWL